jgi:hypothetical protein
MGKLTMAERREEMRLADEQYHPCDIGVHVCGALPDDSGPLTILNLPTATPGEARALFDAAKAVCATEEGEQGDFCVDLNVGWHEMQIADFWMNRQMLERLKQVAALPHPGAPQ